MSQSTAVRPVARAVPRPATRPGARPTAPRLRVVSAPVHARSRAGLVAASLAVLAVGLMGLLLLNVSLDKGAFVNRTQQARIEQLTERRQALQEELAAREAPQSLAAKAQALGMVEAPNVAFVRASDGRILGVPSPGVAIRPATVTGGGSSAGGQGAAATPSASASAAANGAAATAAGKATASTKVTATGKTAATTTSASAGKPASSATGAKASAPQSTGTTRTATKTTTSGTTGTAAATKTAAKPATR